MPTRNTSEYCEVCAEKPTFFASRLGYNYFKCPNCDLIFLIPKLSKVEIESLYSDQDEVFAREDKRFNLLASRLLTLSKEIKGSRIKLLDIGSQNGDFLRALKSLNRFELHGVEPSLSGFIFSSKDNQFKIRHGFFDPTKYSDADFNIVNLGDVIEHVPEAVQIIEQVSTILAPGGFFVITTPITDCTFVSLSNYSNKLLKNHFPLTYLTPPYHLRYFTSKGLDELLYSKGFEKVEHWYTPPMFWYEIAQTQFLNGFRRKSLWQKINPIVVTNLVIFAAVYVISRLTSPITGKDFSFTAVYRLKGHEDEQPFPVI